MVFIVYPQKNKNAIICVWPNYTLIHIVIYIGPGYYTQTQ